MDLSNNIIGITIGIRFAKSFRISDISGEIIDDILYSEKTPFGMKIFPKLQENSTREKILFNPSTSEYLRINISDLIFGIEIKDNFEKKFDWIKDEVLNYFKNTLFKNYGIKNIKRLGIIFSHKIESGDKINKMISELTTDKITDAENISISFSKKASAIESLYRKGVSDYKNSIYSFEEMSDGVLASLDYQYYYMPDINDLRECFVEKILDDAKSFLLNNYYPWLSEYATKKDK